MDCDNLKKNLSRAFDVMEGTVHDDTYKMRFKSSLSNLIVTEGFLSFDSEAVRSRLMLKAREVYTVDDVNEANFYMSLISYTSEHLRPVEERYIMNKIIYYYSNKSLSFRDISKILKQKYNYKLSHASVKSWWDTACSYMTFFVKHFDGGKYDTK